MDGPEPAPAESLESLAALIDLHLLAPQLSEEAIARGCRVAREYGIRAVIVRPSDIESASRYMGMGTVRLASAAGFPGGSSNTAVKLYETRDLLRRGVREIEIVLNVGKTVSREFQYVEAELAQAAQSCRDESASLTVVLRNDLLGAEDLKIIATKIAKRVGAAFVSLVPAAADLQLITPLLRGRIELKGAPVNTLDEALAARAAGCTRLGTTRVEEILDAWRARFESHAERIS